MITFSKEMTTRIKCLYDELILKAQGNRSSEWFRQSDFSAIRENNLERYGVNENIANQTVLVRRAAAIDVMLKTMTDEKISEKTHTGEIAEGDLLLGVLPMGSNGLGKVFPQFMTEDELRAGAITNRNAGSLFGHNTLNYSRLLNEGLVSVIEKCNQKLKEIDVKKEEAEIKTAVANVTAETENNIDADEDRRIRRTYRHRTYNDFYLGVKIACQAVIDYAERFAKIAQAESAKNKYSGERRAELREMAAIARKVPAHPADTFHEAMQSICFFHIALHASMNFISLGRLDQVLQPYLAKETDTERALEIFECFIIKLAGRLNLSSEYLIEQDHVDYATVLGTHPYYIDQKAGVNNFLQNIIIGGKTPDGDDATNDTTYLILQAFTNLNLTTPGIYVRMHKDSPQELKASVAEAVARTKNNPAILNDDIMIEAMYKALMQDDKRALEAENTPVDTEEMREIRVKMRRLANDYCVDGCWEPILNGESDWTFSMLNIMTPLETSMNRGASLSPDDELLRGAKIAPDVSYPKDFDELLANFESQMGFFTDQSVLSLFIYYGIDEYVAPSPLMSAFLGGCMEKGCDKAWAGANHNLGGIIFGGVPNVVNTLAAIRKWVFPKEGCGKYKLGDVRNAFRYNFTCGDVTRKDISNLYSSIQIDFDTNSPKFGNNDPDADDITSIVLDICHKCAMRSGEFGKRIFQNKVEPAEWKNIIALRNISGFYGQSLSRKYGDGFKMKVTAGLGTFEQYNWQGRGIAASADRRSNEPLAPNFSPMPGTTVQGAAGLFESFSKFKLDRFAGGVITDICINEDDGDTETLEKLINKAITSGVPMMTVSVGTQSLYREIYETVLASFKLTNKEDSARMLAPYANVNVRIGGWQTPFITLPVSHMENYINRPVSGRL